MNPIQRFTIMTFPQRYDGADTLHVNILFLPRSQNPLKPAIELAPAISEPTAAFADAVLTFKAVIIKGLEKYPNTKNQDFFKPAPVVAPTHKRDIFTTLADGNHFKIDNKDDGNANLDNPVLNNKNKARNRLNSIKKYLPETYRKSFNFIAPKLKGNAVTDDSYHCAVRDAAPVPMPKPTDVISWGKVFAHILRNPLLAEQAGFIYKTTIEIDAADFEQGGWLYIDLADADIDYRLQENADQDFIKLYAARIPQLKEGEDRQLFAANLFPVTIKANAADPEPPAPEHLDNVFIEAADYDDGFGKILHSYQPVSQHLLQEESDGFHPTHDSGIRLGWDDEQILQWYVRQMSEDQPGSGTRLDAPTGVMGFHIDVKENGTPTWNPLNKVQTKPGVDPLGGLVPKHRVIKFEGEMPYQVYPSTLDGDSSKPYWLPMYFANWNGHSMVLPNKEAIEIYQHDKGVEADNNPLPGNNSTNVTGSPKNQLLKVYEPLDINTTLKYSGLYDFRVRYTDITNGGPVIDDVPKNDALHPVTTCHFKRYVAPTTVRILDEMPPNVDGAIYPFNSLRVQRPLLSYPSVVYTARYSNAVARLLSNIDAQLAEGPKPPHTKVLLDDIGLSDPDVDRVEISVEIQALKMDYQLSISGKESYALLYKTTRHFKVAEEDDDFDNELNIPLKYVEAAVLKFGDISDLGDLGVDQVQLDKMDELVLPKARAIRLTIRAVCEEKTNYYGLEKDDPAFNTRFGRTTYINLYKESEVEKTMFSVKTLQGIYLQPDELPLAKSVLQNHSKIFVEPVKTPDSVQRLAQQLKIESSGLNLVGKKGERIQFACSARIRHTLAPDNSALTFASKEELCNHWLCCITLDINRDWTWDALEHTAFIITRKKFFKQSPGVFKTEVVGEIDIKQSISFTALQNADREYTKVVFIDAVEPKKELSDSSPDFPDLMEVEYTVQTVFKQNHGADNDGDFTFPIMQLPVTINPVQIPRIASAGIALSPYHRNDKYSATEPRRRFLWIEFEQPVLDPNDLYFARVMAYSPDQLISNNNHSLEKPLADPAMNLDPEYIRVIMPGTSDDSAGMNAMQPMEKSLMSDRHYLLPLPPGLNESSPELFGFFAYEFRVGHARIWSTAQARFGRPLKATGIQHPAPTLTCAVNRDEQKLYATAPYATAVFNGKNVTANPPRTQLWCLLYAQVKQADNNDAKKELKDYRNILLEDRFMHWSYKIKHSEKEFEETRNRRLQMGMNERLLQPIVRKESLLQKMQVADMNLQFIEPVTYADLAQQSEDATKYGTAFWTNKEIEALLEAYGLPHDLPLSVLCVEVFSNITSEEQYRTRTVRNEDILNMKIDHEHAAGGRDGGFAAIAVQQKPLSNSLGNFRILRTSPLVEVPFVCCTD